ncbi:hypothetical protein [Pseudomonas paeninsulae]|uniref:hypothetical protein n=1 Tax=Pseudomonas paeninsulae TaxID=3110772 RepID=UPI002D76A95E|nr:hypothetical protein [Pseudomonas sp. IT1137]
MQLFLNNWSSALSLPATASAVQLSITPADAALLAGLGTGDHYLLTLALLDINGSETAWEVVRVTAQAAGVLDVDRGQESTTALDWEAGAPISARLTKASVEGLRGAVVSDAVPQPLGAAAAGTSPDAARADHVHDLPTPAAIGAATTAQGAKADTAVQPLDLAFVATSGLYDDLSGRPYIPVVPADIGAATAAQGALADTAVQPAALTSGLAGKVDVDGAKVLSDENYTTAEKSKLAGLEAQHYRGTYTNLAALQAAVPTGVAGDYADVDAGAADPVLRYIWDGSDSEWVAQAGSADPITAAQVKTLYESNADTTAYTDAEKAKLGGVASGATANADTDSLAESGTPTNKWFTAARVRAAVLTGLSLAVGTAVAATDSVLEAFGKLQKQITDHFGAGGTAHSAATTSVPGFMSAADKTKSDSVASGATANAADAALRDRGTHTGTQAQSTVTNLTTDLAAKMANPMTVAADLIVGGASGAPARLAKGTALQVLRMNAAGTAQEYATPSAGASLAVVQTFAGNKTLALADNNTYNRSLDGTAQTVTLPTQATVAWAADAEIHIEQGAAGSVTITAAAGVSINGVTAGSFSLSGQYAAATLKRTEADAWTLIGMLPGALTTALNEAAIVTLASAATVDIGAAKANTISISGTTTITALGTIASGALRRLVFQGALTLTHNATSLILPTVANITTAAGDVAEFVSLGSGNWRCISYLRADGLAPLGGREVLKADRTYYVRTDGNDSNNGRTNAAGGAFLTIQKAIDVAAALDASIYNVTIQLGLAGTYSGAVLKAFVGSGTFEILGDSAALASYVISSAARTIYGTSFGRWKLRGVHVTSTAAGLYALESAGAGSIIDLADVGLSGVYGLAAATLGGMIRATSPWSILSGAVIGLSATSQGMIYIRGTTLTLSNSPAFSARFCQAAQQGQVDCIGMTFINAGTVTGKRYELATLGLIFTSAAGETYLPGTVAGFVATGGIYA